MSTADFEGDIALEAVPRQRSYYFVAMPLVLMKRWGLDSLLTPAVSSVQSPWKFSLHELFVGKLMATRLKVFGHVGGALVGQLLPGAMCSAGLNALNFSVSGMRRAWFEEKKFLRLLSDSPKPPAYIVAAASVGGALHDHRPCEGVFITQYGNSWIDMRFSVPAILPPASLSGNAGIAVATPAGITFFFQTRSTIVGATVTCKTIEAWCEGARAATRKWRRQLSRTIFVFSPTSSYPETWTLNCLTAAPTWLLLPARRCLRA